MDDIRIKGLNSDKMGWTTSIIGIPLAIILTWVFTAGGINANIQATTKSLEMANLQISQLDTRVRTLELGMERIKVQYDNIQSILNEIKNTLRDNRGSP